MSSAVSFISLPEQCLNFYQLATTECIKISFAYFCENNVMQPLVTVGAVPSTVQLPSFCNYN